MSFDPKGPCPASPSVHAPPGHLRVRRLVHALALALSPGLCGPVLAQATAGGTDLGRVVVTGNPLGNRDPAVPVSVLEGEALLLRRGSSLGATLEGLPGVSSTWFGPNANRPVVRGLDGDRVRILNNAGASLDASSLSFDHAVPLDPLVVERLEVLRGPGALLYGGGAVGGVVNAIDNRIPRAPLRGTSGAVELRLGGADAERGVAALVETGNDRYGLHLDLAGRNTSNLHVPDFEPVVDGERQSARSRIVNSASRSRSAAVGGSLFFEHGRLGLSVDRYENRYGIVVEPDVTIDMVRDHVGVAGELRAGAAGPVIGIDKLALNLNHTRYRHQEIEGSGAVGTTFRTAGDELRIEATHVPWPVFGGVRGVVGLQLEDADFSALGEEAFVPSTRTRKRALFVLEELGWAGGTLSAGLRAEQVRVDSQGDADPTAPQFGPPASRRFGLRSASVANLWPLAPGWALNLALSATERAPTSFELYANGVHAATAAFERGDPTLGKERGRNLDLALQWRAGDSRARIGAYVARFSRFISLEATGATVDVTGEDGGVESVPEYVFRPVRARLSGVELEASHRWRAGGWTVDGSGQLDLTRARQTDTGEPLPRIAPRRITLGLAVARGPWRGQVELVHAARQDRVPVTDTATAGYSVVNLALSRRFAAGASREGVWFLKLGNVGDRLAYSAAAVQTVRGLSPLPGRALQTGVRVDF